MSLKLPVFKYDFDGREISPNDTLRSISTYATYHVVEVQDDKLLVEMQTFRSYAEKQPRDLPVSTIQQSYIYSAQMYQIEKKG